MPDSELTALRGHAIGFVLQDLMRRIDRERSTTFLIVAHNLALAPRCDRILDVVDGRISGQGARQAQEVSPAGIATSPASIE